MRRSLIKHIEAGNRYKKPPADPRYARIIQMGRLVHHSFRAISLLFLLGLIVTVGLVLLAVGGPILLNIDILAEPTYTRITDFMRRMLSYIVACAIGYVVTSWGSRLTLPERHLPTAARPWDGLDISRPQGSRPERPGSL